MAKDIDHYFSAKPHSPLREESFSITILDETFTINSASGIFSVKELDFGTKLLIENAQIPKKQNVEILDLGCGYGIVGIAMKSLHPESAVTLIDVNPRAVKCAEENCAKNHVDAIVLKSDIFSHPDIQKKQFDVILTNPPFSAGKQLCIEFIRQSHTHLKKGGTLQLVAPHNKGGQSLKKIMLEVFNNAGELAKKSGYRVYISVKK